MRKTLLMLIALTSITRYSVAEDYSDVPSTGEKLEARAAEFKVKYPAEMIELMQEGIDVASRVEATAINVGDKAPDFTLPNAVGKEITLSELLQTGPVVITWYRGGWCPYCNIQLYDLSQLENKFETAGAQLVAISPEQPDSSLSTQEKQELDFHVLSDLHNKVAREYGIVFELTEPLKAIYGEHINLEAYNSDDSYELPLAVTYVVDQDRIVRWAFVDGDYKQRAEPKDILLAVRALDNEN